MSRKSLAIGIMIGLIIGLPTGFLLPQILNNQFFSTSQNAGYTKVTVVAGQGASITFGDNAYAFSYTAGQYGFGSFINMVTKSLAMKTYSAVQGAVYSDYGIEILVSEVHTDYVVLMVKSTVPT